MCYNKIFVYSFIISAALFTACKDDYDLPDQPVESYTKIYMPQAVVTPVEYILKISDTVQTLTYSASYGGQNYPDRDIEVSFDVNNMLVDSFNLANGTSYAKMPGTSYTISHSTATIPEGKLSTGPLAIDVRTNGAGAIDILKDYLLPVSIHSKDEKINEQLRTAFFKIRAQPNLNDYPVFNRSNWVVIGFSSQEANGEGPTNGRAIFCLDDDPATFWHTQWQGGQPGPPHFITIDMGVVKTVHGLYFLDRQSNDNGKPKDVLVKTSLDNVTWTDAGKFTLANTKDLQSQFLSAFIDARYINIIIQNSYSATYTHLAELKAF
jgi:hypothetical protein